MIAQKIKKQNDRQAQPCKKEFPAALVFIVEPFFLLDNTQPAQSSQMQSRDFSTAFSPDVLHSWKLHCLKDPPNANTIYCTQILNRFLLNATTLFNLFTVTQPKNRRRNFTHSPVPQLGL